MLPRWHVNFNITMLRIVSFGQDYHWRTAQTTQVEVGLRCFALYSADSRYRKTTGNAYLHVYPRRTTIWSTFLVTACIHHFISLGPSSPSTTLSGR